VAAYPPGLNLLLHTVERLYCLLVMSGCLALVGLLGIAMKAPANSTSKLRLDIFKVRSRSHV